MIAARLAHSQTPPPDRLRIIGYLNPGTDPKLTLAQDPALQRFLKLGWIDGKTFVIDRRHAEFKYERLPEFAQELIRKRAEVLITNGSAATLAAARATRTIPIVFFNVPFPVEQGFIDSFARPGRNLTGTSAYIAGMGRKRFEFLRELAPGAKRVYVINASEYQENLAGAKAVLGQTGLGEPAERLGFEVKHSVIRNGSDIEPALAEALSWGAHALFVAPSFHAFAARHRITEFALQHRFASFFIGALYVEAGGLLSYAVSLQENWALVTRCMEYVDRILRGARPSDLPVEQPRDYELVINMKTAKALGLSVPQSMLLRAARVIE